MGGTVIVRGELEVVALAAVRDVKLVSPPAPFDEAFEVHSNELFYALDWGFRFCGTGLRAHTNRARRITVACRCLMRVVEILEIFFMPVL